MNKAPDKSPDMTSNLNIELFATNLARMVEEGGKALAAYLKPREHGMRQKPPVRGDDGRRQDARPGGGILAVGSDARGAVAGEPRARLSRSVGRSGQAPRGRSGQAGGRARCTRPALRRPGMVVEPVFRFHEAGLFALDAMGRSSRQGRQGARSAHAAKGGVLHQADRQRGFAVEFRPDQSAIAARDAVIECRQPRARHEDAGAGH